ncbi:MAG: phosphotransferase [Erysipelotrichaceae bacterium]
MNLKEQLLSLYFSEITSIEKLTLGLTNDNYLLVSQEKKYFIRVPDKNIEHHFDRTLEKNILDQLQDIDIPYLYFDCLSGIKITPFFSSLKTYQEENNPQKHVLVAKLLKQLHHRQIKCHIDFNVRAKVKAFKKDIKDFIFDLSAYDYLLDYYDNYQSNKTLCHNDLVDGNLVFINHKLAIIDYEYAGNNYPIFDLTSFITENNIFDSKIKKEFYQTYFGQLDNKLLEEIANFEKLHHYLWCHWAMMMYQIKKDNLYYQIALDKYQQLINY